VYRTGTVKKILFWGAIAFLMFIIAYSPSSFADVMQSIGHGIVEIAEGFGGFFVGLVT
jgi:hypothetical protein